MSEFTPRYGRVYLTPADRMAATNRELLDQLGHSRAEAGDWTICGACGGDGDVDGTRCRRCRGTGEVRL